MDEADLGLRGWRVSRAQARVSAASSILCKNRVSLIRWRRALQQLLVGSSLRRDGKALISDSEARWAIPVSDWLLRRLEEFLLVALLA